MKFAWKIIIIDVTTAVVAVCCRFRCRPHRQRYVSFTLCCANWWQFCLSQMLSVREVADRYIASAFATRNTSDKRRFIFIVLAESRSTTLRAISFALIGSSVHINRKMHVCLRGKRVHFCERSEFCGRYAFAPTKVSSPSIQTRRYWRRDDEVEERLAHADWINWNRLLAA